MSNPERKNGLIILLTKGGKWLPAADTREVDYKYLTKRVMNQALARCGIIQSQWSKKVSHTNCQKVFKLMMKKIIHKKTKMAR